MLEGVVLSIQKAHPNRKFPRTGKFCLNKLKTPMITSLMLLSMPFFFEQGMIGIQIPTVIAIVAFTTYHHHYQCPYHHHSHHSHHYYHRHCPHSNHHHSWPSIAAFLITCGFTTVVPAIAMITMITYIYNH